MTAQLVRCVLILASLVVVVRAWFLLFDRLGEGSDLHFIITSGAVLLLVGIGLALLDALRRTTRTFSAVAGQGWRSLNRFSRDQKRAVVTLRLIGYALEMFRGSRGVRRVVVAAIAGCVVSVAVSWAFVLKWELVHTPVMTSELEPWLVAQEAATTPRVEGSETKGTGVRHWYFLSHSPSSGALRSAHQIDSGWPARCLRSTVVLEDNWTGVRTLNRPVAGSWFERGLRLPATIAQPMAMYGRLYERHLPLRVLPGAFAMNSAVYGICILLVPVVVGTVRWNLRLDAGRCPRCSYDWSASGSRVCPECGYGTPRDAASETAPG